MKQFLRSSLIRNRALLVLCMLATMIVLPAARTQSAGPLSLPSGFVDEVAVGGLYVPRAWVWTPDGRILITERGSAASMDENIASIRVFKDGALLATRALTIDVQGNGERGLLGLALDPNFASNGYLYTYYTRQGSNAVTCNGVANKICNRVSRWTMTGDTIDPGSEWVLVDNIQNEGGIHNAGDLQFGSDGTLFISTGEGSFSESPARDPSIMAGKILRIKPDPAQSRGYSIPNDNPFRTTPGSRVCGPLPVAGGSGPCQEIYAIGLRNPFRIAIKPGTSIPYAFDVGGGTWEEVNEIVAGGDYGYPNVEGPCPQAQDCSGPVGTYRDPVFAYPHTNGAPSADDAAIIGGAFYTGTAYPNDYNGNIFYADFVQGDIHRLLPDGSGWDEQMFGEGTTAIIGLRSGPDGNIYYMTLNDGDRKDEIRRISYRAGVNQPPTARISADITSGPINATFTFSGAASTDPEGTSLSYQWNFGYGTSQTTATSSVTKVYSTVGAKVVTLRVVDSGAPPATSEPATITVFPGNSPATGEIVLTNQSDPQRNSLYRAGDTWSFSIANLADDQTPPENIQVKWQVDFHHREHNHPFLGLTDGRTGTMTIPTSGEYDYVVWYRVRMFLTDAQGQTTTITRDIYPELTTVTLASNPPGALMYADANPIVATTTLTRVVGFQMGIIIDQPQLLNGNYYMLQGWSDGVTESTRTLAVPPGEGTYTASFLQRRLMLPALVNPRLTTE